MKLIFVNGKRAGEEYELNPETTRIGREVDNDISILEAGLSRHHALIQLKDEQWTITDLQSTNGVKVNGEKISEATPLQEGDDVFCGNQQFVFGARKEKQPGADASKSETSAGPAAEAADNADGSGIFIKVPDVPKEPDTILEKPADKDNTGLQIKMPDSLKEEGVSDAPKEASNIFNLNAPEPLPASDDSRSDQQTEGGLQIKSPDQAPEESEKKPPEPAEEPEEKKPAESRKEDIQNFFESFSAGGDDKMSAQDSKIALDKIDLFGSGNAKDKKPDKKSDGKKGGSYRPSNLLFYVVVIGLAIIAISLFVMWEKMNNKQSKQPAPGAGQRQPKPKLFFLVYEKKISSPDNILRFYMKVEGEKVLAVLDDLKYGRRLRKEFTIGKDFKKEYVELLKDNVKETDFMNLKSPPEGRMTEQKDTLRSLTIGYNTDLNTIKVKNAFAPASFETIEAAVDEFAQEALKIKSTGTVEEMLARAKQYFEKAEHLYDNWKANPANLRDAVKYYKEAMTELDTFDPPPEIWTISNKKYKEANNLLDEQFKSHNFNAIKALKLGDYAVAQDEYKKIMDLLDSDDPRFPKVRKKVLQLDDILRKMKKK